MIPSTMEVVGMTRIVIAAEEGIKESRDAEGIQIMMMKMIFPLLKGEAKGGTTKEREDKDPLMSLKKRISKPVRMRIELEIRKRILKKHRKK